MAWSDAGSLAAAIETLRGVYHSRSRGRWVKGETSGAIQELLEVDVDCDRDTLRFTVHQHDAFCHTGERTCWGADRGLGRLERRLAAISTAPDPASNTGALLERPALLAAKLVEEATELAGVNDPEAVAAEAADLLYFLMVKAAASGVPLQRIMAELDRRERRLTRRPMVAKGIGR